MTNIEPTGWDVRPDTGGAAPGEAGHRGWLNRLVELHVLAEHGDQGAATEAGQWIAVDPDARQVWEDVERLRDHLRAADNTHRTDRI